MKDDKIVHIGKNKRSLEDELLEIAQLINGEEASDDSNIEKSYSYISGTGNVIGNGNTVNNVINFNSPVKKPRVQVKTGDGVVDANQKHQIKTLIYEWVETHNAVKKTAITHNAAWIRLNKSMKVNSYHEIKSDDFSKSIKYLRTQIGILRNMASAPQKVTDWRKETIKSIQTRCSKNGWQEWRKSHMAKKFQKSSMTELTDSELQQLYQTVWGKR
ncbi:hypothetical protein [Pectobacterium atrosepticum]|uniref:hypothetical protein n=1 Tax=Pectobacterium atrosepticum TaxID=29471 RepID=UPI0004E8384A|nr:hypothetical protein [Pectobacterium atrosepticum]AIK14232.1 hypothetical protein GZ59_24350 [Pectobacterium atrosepticum]ATY91661.1 hypothetical protein CVS35_15490 [Pectobacterium atrosepticum]KFX13277.1 hypothetical protein JV34_15795 [Pectobacterium atrosepticum]KMK81952.1 putative DNA-binding protein [Pectobacterium atrosepticum ICMP 1526]PWD65574.1 hypothetical protein DF214_02750 [Pectobacterium atrosepticum]